MDTEELRAEWLAAVERILAGRPFDDVLTSRTRGGLVIEPLYTRANTPVAEPDPPGTGSHVRGPFDPDRSSRGWDVRQHHGGADPDSVSAAIIEDLEGGVTSIELDPPTGGWGTDGLARSLAGVLLDVAPVHLAPHADLDAARSLVELWDRTGPGETRGGLGLDPIGEWGRSGADPSVTLAECTGFVIEHLGERPLVTGMVVDVERYVDAGADEVQELAWGTATAVAYLRALTNAGLDLEVAADNIGFRWAATAEQFVTIAKLRAARRMWARVLEASGMAETDREQKQQAVTPISLYSRLDPWVNLIRGTTAALAGVVGGADSVTVRPFDTLSGGAGRAREVGPTAGIGRRTARNTQILLREESHLGHSLDPGGGSWFVESLTDRLAHAAWERFREIERSGGMADHVASGALTEQIDASWSARLAALGRREESLTGVNQFPHLGATDTEPVEGSGTSVGKGPDDPGRAGLPIRRPAEPFERLRDAADRHHASTGSRPVVHIVALGPRAGHASRTTWVTNLLAVGGIAVTGGEVDGAESPIAAEASFCESGACVAVISGPDDLYETRGESAALALTEAGADLVALVGEPGDSRDALVASGVDEFWYEGIDVLAALRRLHAVLGIAQS